MTPQISPQIPAHFEQTYQRLLNCLKLGGMQPKTIELYSHGVRRAGAYFDYRIDELSKSQLTDYFVHIIDALSWSSLILALQKGEIRLKFAKYDRFSETDCCNGNF